MFNKGFSTLFDFFYRHKYLFISVVILLFLLSIARLHLIRKEFRNDVALMLPTTQEVRNSMNFFRYSNFGDKIVLSFTLHDTKKHLPYLLNVVDTFAKKLDSPQILNVEYNVSKSSPLDDLQRLMRYIPQLISQKQLEQLGAQISDSGVQHILKKSYRAILSPGGQFRVKFIQQDPYNLCGNIFNEVQSLASPLGYHITPQNGYFVSQDGRSALMIIKTSVPMTDSSGSMTLLHYLDEQIKQTPSDISVAIIAGHRHAVSNETIIKKDIAFTLTLSAVAFILLFILILKRNLRWFILLGLPVVASFMAMAVISFVFPHISLFIIGMGGVITGITIDYGIHIYIAINGTGDVQHVKKIAKPILFGGITTIGAFLAFFFSNVEGYQQLSAFALVSIVVALFLSLFLLPILLHKEGMQTTSLPKWLSPNKNFSSSYSRYVILGCWGLTLVLGIIFACQQKLDSNITQFDGADKQIIEEERAFHKTWGGAHPPAILVTSSEDLETLFEENETLTKECQPLLKQGAFSNLTTLWGSQKTRAQNLKHWNQFWEKHRRLFLHLLKKYSEQFQFSEEAFKPFTTLIEKQKHVTKELPNIPLFNMIKKQFMYKQGNRYFMLSFFPDTKDAIQKIRSVQHQFPNSFIVSRQRFSGILSELISKEIISLIGIGAFLIPLLTFLLLRNIKQTLLALLPMISSLIITSGALSLIGIPLNAPVFISALILVGLSIDYGIFMVFAIEQKIDTETTSAITLSVLTTIIGAGAVIFAVHPLLYSVGVTMVIGLITAYLVAIFVIPAMKKV